MGDVIDMQRFFETTTAINAEMDDMETQVTATTEKAPSRFDYVKYDPRAQHQQMHAKSAVMHVEECIGRLDAGGATERALTALEECYMWIGKAIRDEQVATRGADLQP